MISNLLLLISAALGVAAAAGTTIPRVRSSRSLEKGDSRRPGDPIYWEMYRQKHGVKFRRCRDFAGAPPRVGAVCNKKKIGDYFCLFGDQVCADKTHHPTTWCDCEKNEEDSNRHWQCKEHLPDECTPKEDDEDEDDGDEDDQDENFEESDDDAVDDKFDFDPDEFFNQSLNPDDMEDLPSLEEMNEENEDQSDEYDEYDESDEYDEYDEDEDEFSEDDTDFCDGNELIEGKSASGSTEKKAKKAARKAWKKEVLKLMPMEPEQGDWHTAELFDYDCRHYKSDDHYKCKAYGIPCADEEDEDEDERRQLKRESLRQKYGLNKKEQLTN